MLPSRLTVALTLVLAPAALRAAPEVSDFTLGNGLRVVVIEDHRAPIVTNMVWYRVGAADEPPGRSGVAHFLEHLMFKGTDDLAEGEFSRIVAANGGNDNAFTSRDYTAYFQRIAADRLELVISMEADRMVDLSLTEAAVATERQVVLEERSQRTDNDPGAQFGEQLSAALYLNHPYGDPVIGWRSEIEALDREDALDVYRRFYAPDNAILVVAGDVEPRSVLTLARRHFGPLEPSGAALAPRPAEPPHLAPRRVEMRDARVRQPYMRRSYLVPTRVSGGAGDAAALSVLAEILGGGQASRFTREIEIAQGVAIRTGAFYSADARDDAEFTVFAVPAPGRTLAQAEAAIDAALADIAETGPSEDELARARAGFAASEIYAQDSGMGLAMRYGLGLAAGLTIAEIEAWPETLAAVTAEDVRRAARMLRTEASVTGWLRRADTEEIRG